MHGNSRYSQPHYDRTEYRQSICTSAKTSSSLEQDDITLKTACEVAVLMAALTLFLLSASDILCKIVHELPALAIASSEAAIMDTRL